MPPEPNAPGHPRRGTAFQRRDRHRPARAESRAATTQPKTATVDEIVESFVYLYSEGRRLHAEQSATYGLTSAQLAVLTILNGLGGELRTSTIGERLRAHASTVTGIVDRMVRDGWVERVNDELDRRVVRVRLTPRGRELARRVPSTAMDLLRRAVARLSAGEQRQLLTIFGRLGQELAAVVQSPDSA